jgi:putative ABC transport system permease protein
MKGITQSGTSRGVNFAVVDHDFIETLGINMVGSRDFSRDFIGDTLTGVLEDDFMEQFSNDRNRRAIFASFTILVIIIACLGLFGRASYTTERRASEIGVRKVFGASIERILRMISWEFLKLILISFVLAIPAVWFLMSNWLENYVYRYSISPLNFLWTILLILLPTILTVSFQSYKAATSNPADSMRSE